MTKLQTKVLSYCLKRWRSFGAISRRFRISIDDLNNHVLDSELQRLLTADTSADQLEDFRLLANNAGVCYIESLRKDNFRFRFPVFLSVAAIIISIIALLK